uniref:Orphan G-protein coupled receptor 46 n=1 Tax=Platynereis dumerilii TaxID=6359 RepID=A0A0K0PUJ2_PLADU|nr:orphan G-protein coupled receptor 46 [Platynereis dumerilii]
MHATMDGGRSALVMVTIRSNSTAFSNLNSNTNGTNADTGATLPGYTQRIIIGILLGNIIFLTVFGNCLVISAVVCFRRLRSVTNYFVVSLAVADMTVAVFVMPYSLLFEIYGEWRFGWVFCYFWISCDVTCCTASILHLCVISLDRYLAITGPLSYHRRMSKLRAVTMIVGVWICSIAISFLPIFLGWFADHSQMDLYTDSANCGLYVNKIYAVISSAMSFYIPLVVMLCVYFKIFRIAQSQAREIHRLEKSVDFSSGPNDLRFGRKSRKFKKDIKAIRTLGTLMGLFCVSWLPFFLMYLIMPFCSSCNFPATLVSAITWLGYINSSINPCIYTLLNRDFRIAFRKLVTCNALVNALQSEHSSNQAALGKSAIKGDSSIEERQNLRDMSPHLVIRAKSNINGHSSHIRKNVAFEHADTDI